MASQSKGRPEASAQEIQAELDSRLMLLADQLYMLVGNVAAEFEMTPQQTMLLRHLEQPHTMGELAHVLACDRSNITGLIDRMEARHLVERVSDAQDRRIKRIVLTAYGRTQLTRIQERFLELSPTGGSLGPEERRQLLLLLRKLTPEA
ncbi:MAG TPA: MarR family winged helix-turn-helix transcriptional regulator [Ktedonobacteraceae bacterium]|nr:MarR family winged helix-turn-helix transcriptional regulator [Ktedonobacteraceae bacterium]